MPKTIGSNCCRPFIQLKKKILHRVEIFVDLFSLVNWSRYNSLTNVAIQSHPGWGGCLWTRPSGFVTTGKIPDDLLLLALPRLLCFITFFLSSRDNGKGVYPTALIATPSGQIKEGSSSRWAAAAVWRICVKLHLPIYFMTFFGNRQSYSNLLWIKWNESTNFRVQWNFVVYTIIDKQQFAMM